MTLSYTKQPAEPRKTSKPPLPETLNICVISPDFIGLTEGTQAGIAPTAMAQALAAAGHKVTCLFLGLGESTNRGWQRWVEKYKADGLELLALPQINASELVGPANLVKSYEAYHWLRKNDRFDVIHFPEKNGPGYHTLTAKQHGLAFARATICVGLNSVSALLDRHEKQTEKPGSEIDTSFMERRAVAMADAIVGANQNLVHWISERAKETELQAREQQPAASEPALRQLEELVYFGTLETSKGLLLFCDALDALPPAVARNIHTVTFLGNEAIIDGIPAINYVQKRSHYWPFPVQFMADLHEAGTIQYLQNESRLAVIPSLVENSPNRVLECLVGKIAFIASRVKGNPEQIAADDVDKVCFDTTPSALAATLCTAVTGGIRCARPVRDARTAGDVLSSSSRWPVSATETDSTAVRALSLNPTNPMAMKVLARMHLNAGSYDAAQEACQWILKANPMDAEALQLNEEARKLEAALLEGIVQGPASATEMQATKNPFILT